MPLRLPTPGADTREDPRALEPRETPASVRARADFVSAQRAHQVLRARFGARPTGERGPGYLYWQTAEGVMFPLEDPLAVPGSKSIVRADGSEQLFYSYGYVVTLLRRVDEAGRAAREERDSKRALEAQRRAAGAAHTSASHA